MTQSIVPQFFFKDSFSKFESIFLKNGGTVKHIRKGEVLHRANSVPQTSYYIKNGIAKLNILNEDGVESTLIFFSDGSIYPITCLKEPLALESYLQLIAVTDLDVISFPADKIVDMAANHVALIATIIEHYAKYASTILSKTLLTSYNDSHKCVSSFLYLYSVYSNSQIVHLTQTNLSQITGFSRMQIVRVLSALKERDIIETSRNTIKIRNADELKKICSDIVAGETF